MWYGCTLQGPIYLSGTSVSVRRRASGQPSNMIDADWLGRSFQLYRKSRDSLNRLFIAPNLIAWSMARKDFAIALV